MSVTTPAYIIPRKSLVGYEGEWVKMFDPPTVSPATPENLELTKLWPEPGQIPFLMLCGQPVIRRSPVYLLQSCENY